MPSESPEAGSNAHGAAPTIQLTCSLYNAVYYELFVKGITFGRGEGYTGKH